MSYVRTVLGDIDSRELGVTNIHDHLLIRAGVGVLRNSDFHLDSVEKACEEVELFKAGGGQSIVDMMPMGTGRDAEGLVEVARRTGVNVIAASGFHQAEYYTGDHWIHRYSSQQLADLFVADITLGMDRYDYTGPLVDRLNAKAGVLKVATEHHLMLPVQHKLFEAVAEAHQRTGAPISTHTTLGTFALEQVEKLCAYGVAPDAVIVGHVDRNLDLGYHKAIAQTGAYLDYDGPSRIKYYPDSKIIEVIGAMFESGYGAHVLLGNDLATRSSHRSYGGGPGLGYLLDVFVPRLQEAGMSQSDVEQILVENPSRALSLRKCDRGHA